MKTKQNSLKQNAENRCNTRARSAAVDGKPPLKSPEGAEELEQIRGRIEDLLARCASLSSQIDSAFGGQAFLPELGPLDPANQRRFWACFHEHRKVTKLLIQALQLWRASFGGKTGLLDSD